MIDSGGAFQRRRAAKVILVDRTGSVLLFRGGDPGRPEEGTHWFPPGGGIDHGETEEQAAIREVREETGLEIADVGPVVATRQARFTFDGITFDSDEVYFLIQVDRFDLDDRGWTDIERRVVVEHRWWPRDELISTTETVYPEGLLTILSDHGF